MHTFCIKRCRVSQLYQLSSESEVFIALCCQISAIFNLLLSSTNQGLLEKRLCNHSSHYEKHGQSVMQRKPSRATTKLTLFTVSKGEWNTQEDTGKLWRIYCSYCSMSKDSSWAEAMSNSEKTKPWPLLSYTGINQSVSQVGH